MVDFGGIKLKDCVGRTSYQPNIWCYTALSRSMQVSSPYQHLRASIGAGDELCVSAARFRCERGLLYLYHSDHFPTKIRSINVVKLTDPQMSRRHVYILQHYSIVYFT